MSRRCRFHLWRPLSDLSPHSRKHIQVTLEESAPPSAASVPDEKSIDGQPPRSVDWGVDFVPSQSSGDQPAGWTELYRKIVEIRKHGQGQNAPVDVMGCSELADEETDEKVRLL